MWLILCAWSDLFYVDVVGLGGFRAVHQVVSRVPLRARVVPPDDAVMRIIGALEIACAWYVRPTRCLLRSAVATRLLRRRGVPAQMIIGCHHAPLRGHAWVTVADTVVSDDQPGLEFYQVLDRW